VLRLHGCLYGQKCASKQDKHRGRLDDTNMRVSSEPDNTGVSRCGREEAGEEWQVAGMLPVRAS
jgi:hypothetical protein